MYKIKLNNSLIILFLLLFSGIKGIAQQCLPQISPGLTISMSNNGCGSPSTVAFTNTSYGTEATSRTYYWYINGSIIDTTTGLTAPSNISKTTGNYTVSLIVSSSLGCKDTFMKSFTIIPKPVASFNPS